MSYFIAHGRVTTDLELKKSTKQHPYVQFSFAEQIGYGEHAHPQYMQVWAWDALATQLVKRGVGKGSLISVSGSLELEEYTKRDGVTRDKRLKLKLKDWEFLPAARRGKESQKKEGTPRTEKAGTAGIIDAEREPLPE